MVWVHNSSDSERAGNSRHELQNTLREDELRGLPLLVFVNTRPPGCAAAHRPDRADNMPSKSHWADSCHSPLVPVTAELLEDFFDLRKPVTVDWSDRAVTAFLMGTHRHSVLQQLRGNSNLLEHIWRFVQPLERIEIHTVCTDRPWRVQEYCALTGDGLQEGLDWLQAELAKSGAPGKYKLW